MQMGFVRSAIFIVGFVLAIYVGARFAPCLGDMMGTSLPAGPRYGIAFTVVFLAVLFVAGLVGKVLGKVVTRTPINALDHAAGAVLGALKAVLLLAIIAVVLALLPISPSWSETYTSSRVVQTSIDIGRFVIRIVEPHVSEPISDFIDAAQAYISRKTKEELERRAKEGAFRRM